MKMSHSYKNQTLAFLVTLLYNNGYYSSLGVTMRLKFIENNEQYKKEASLSLSGFILCLPALIVSLYAAFTANTIIVWADTIATFGETLHCYVVYASARRMYKETGENYNYGLGRLEVIISIGCELLLCAALLTVAGSAAYCIYKPQQPADSLGSFCILKAINILYDAIYLVKQYKITKAHPSAMSQTELKVYVNALLNDVVVGVVVVTCFFFRSYAWSLYLNPIATIILSSAFFVQYAKHIRSSFFELADYSLPVPTQDKLFDIVLADRGDIISRIETINCRKLNNTVHVDVSVRFNDNVTYLEQAEFLDKLTADIREVEPDSEVQLVISNKKQD